MRKKEVQTKRGESNQSSQIKKPSLSSRAFKLFRIFGKKIIMCNVFFKNLFLILNLLYLKIKGTKSPLTYTKYIVGSLFSSPRSFAENDLPYQEVINTEIIIDVKIKRGNVPSVITRKISNIIYGRQVSVVRIFNRKIRMSKKVYYLYKM